MPSNKSAIDTDLIRELAELLNETELSEIEVMEGELSIRLAKGGSVMAAPAPVQMAAPAAPAAAASATPSAPAAAPEQSAPSGTPVPSPMVGTAYHSPAPGADPFVAEGQSVRKGQAIMIVEAMKTMNQINAPKDGVVKSICVEDGQPVEYGEALIILE